MKQQQQNSKNRNILQKIYIVFCILVLINSQQYKIKSNDKINNAHENYELIYKGNDNFYKEQSNLIIKNAQLQIRKETENQFDFKIIDKQNDRYEIPTDLPGLEDLYQDIENPQPLSSEYLYSYSVNQDPFCITVKRVSTSEVVFTTCQNKFIFSDLYIEISTMLPTNFIFGLGERNSESLRLKKGGYTLYGRDDPSLIEDNQFGNNVYSSHPMYLVKEKSGNFNVVFYKYSGGIDVLNLEKSLTYKAIGGIVHFKMFFGDKNPETAIQLYHRYLGGGYQLPPFWSLGFHQSRWGYRDGKKLIYVAQKHVQEQIPLDTMWSDLDFMHDKQTFSVNTNLYTAKDYDVLQNDMHLNYVPLVDVAVGSQKYKDDEALLLGKKLDIFCRSPQTGLRFKGNVWPGPSYFPDFFHKDAHKFWIQNMERLHQKTNYSGMWLDMNEPANFCNGECRHNDVNQDQQVNPLFMHKPFKYPYILGEGRKFQDIDYKSLPGHLIHSGGYFHKDVHNLYGFLDTIYTNMALKKLNKPLPFILSRSTFPGSGKFGQHWCGDNHSSWEFLRISIPQIILFNFFGIPMTGSDICGFMGNTNAELCQRWIQVSVLQPFVRNHNNDQARDQELYNLGESVKKTARQNLRLRYSLLKYYYTVFIRKNGAGTVMKPLFFEFPQDEKTYEDKVMNEQYMVGSELMATPIIYKNQQSTQAYFPGQWNDLLTGQQIEQGVNPIFSNLEGMLPIYIQQGKLVPFQPQLKLNTYQMDNQFDLIASLKKSDEYMNLYDIDYYSVGYLMNIRDYLDEEDIVEYCVEDNNCLIKVIVGLNKSKKMLKIFLENTSNIQIQENIIINDLKLYNIPKNTITSNNQTVTDGDYPYCKVISLGHWDLQNNNKLEIQL